MIFYASIVLSLYFSWKSVNKRVAKHSDYLFHNFEADWERLRGLAERADDVFSMTVFIAWVADIACAVGYLGSIVIYGAGGSTEQVYTVFGLCVHAIWNSGCYLLPCILFQEEVCNYKSPNSLISISDQDANGSFTGRLRNGTKVGFGFRR